MDRRGGRAAAIVLPGGPGLAPDYMLPWARAAAAHASISVALLEYPIYTGSEAMPPSRRLEAFKDGLIEVSRRIGTGDQFLIGHSFSCRLIINLLSTRRTGYRGAFLMNCPADFSVGTEFIRRKARLRLPGAIKDERDFAAYWRTVLPLYFGVTPKRGWLGSIAARTSWMGSQWLTEAIHGEVPRGRRNSPPMLFLHGTRDIRYKRENRGILKRKFRSAWHVSSPGIGHFPMLEATESTARKFSEFIGRIID